MIVEFTIPGKYIGKECPPLSNQTLLKQKTNNIFTGGII